MYPKLRFKGFDDAWEQRKLSDIGNIITGSTPSTKDKNNYNGDFLFVSPADIQGNRFVEKTITTLSELGFKKGRILAPKSTLFVSIGSTIGKVAQIRDFAVTNQQINSIEPFKDIDPDFVFSLMQKESPSIRCLSATQAVPILNKTTFSNVEVSIASNINEQYRIGELFIKLDSTITLHQRELDSLKKLKKSLLQKMFPKNGEKIPELRFPEFTGDWEQRKLGDITDSFSGGTPKVGNEEYYGGEIPFIRSAEINSSTTELYITKKGLDNSSAKMVSKGTILYALYGATSGECGISQIDGAINQAILAIKPKCGYVPYFISTWLRRSKFSIVSTFLQGGQGNLSGEIVKNLSLMLPCQNEQKKIGELFKKLDSTITLHQRELDTLKKLKKGLLQNMFV